MYNLEYLPSCKEEIKKLTAKDKKLGEILNKKIERLIENPYYSSPCTGRLTGFRDTHVMKSFVLVLKIFEEKKTVMIVKFGHHDEAFENLPDIYSGFGSSNR